MLYLEDFAAFFHSFFFFLPERYLFHSTCVPFGNLENQKVQHPAETTILMRAERHSHPGFCGLWLCKFG